MPNCLDILPKYKESIDVICTSPPYGIKIKYPKYKDNLKYDKFMDFMYEFGCAARKAIKPTGSLFLNFGNIIKEPNKASDVAREIQNNFNIQNTIIWVKALDSEGHFKPINSNKYLNNNFEFIFHFTRTPIDLDKLSIGIKYTDKSNMKRWKKPDIRDNGNVWFIPYETIQSKTYPSIFPVELPYRCIKLHGIKDGMIVCDPFAGSNSTGAACRKIEKENNIKIKYIGIDL